MCSLKSKKTVPLGYLEVRLTPGRSIAMDRRLFPLAGLGFIETQKAVDHRILETIRPIGRIFLDLYCIRIPAGPFAVPAEQIFSGETAAQAEIAAGHMKHPGNTLFPHT